MMTKLNNSIALLLLVSCLSGKEQESHDLASYSKAALIVREFSDGQPLTSAQQDLYKLDARARILYQFTPELDGMDLKLIALSFPDSALYMEHFLIYRAADTSPIRLARDGGYNLKLALVDFDGDGSKDLFMGAATGGSGSYYTYNIISFAAETPSFLLASEEEAVVHIKNPKYNDNYILSLDILETNEHMELRIIAPNSGSNNAEKLKFYRDIGLYDEAGLFQSNVFEPYISYYGILEPVDINADAVFELRGLARLIGQANHDTIAYVSSLWSYKNKNWENIELRVTTDLE